VVGGDCSYMLRFYGSVLVDVRYITSRLESFMLVVSFILDN
jgi:hypothetical protein